ncbi:MAG: hypothetical protein U1A78_15330 [Polyangia bacterium]
MSGGIDAKGIGLAVKDIVVGIAAAAVGAAGGGQAGASGVLKAGDGIDKIVGMTTDEDSRAQRFDRADFASKPNQTPQAPSNKAASQQPAQPLAPTDRELALAHLASVGWDQEQANKILAGPQKQPMAQIAPPQVDGQRVQMTQGSAVDLEPGSPVALTSGEAIKPQGGTAVPLVEGRRVPRTQPA